MRLNIKLYLLVAFGSAFYLGILWETHKEAFFALYYTDDEAQEHRIETAGGPQRQNEDQSSGRSNKKRKRGWLNGETASKKSHGRHLHHSLKKFRESGHLPKGHQFRHNPGDERPAFHSVVDEFGNVTGSVESVLDFAVIGFGKCGTTSMITWLDQHPELQTFPSEIYDLMFNRVGAFLKKIYSMPVGNYRRGYKSPADLSVLTAVDAVRTHFPKTKLIIGVRHPVLWFQSLYNFRVQNFPAKKNHSDFPRPIDLIGRCVKKRRNTCTNKGEFGLHLRNLGKTLARHNPRDPATGLYDMTELEYHMYDTSKMIEPFPDVQHPVPNPVFLFEMNQLSDNNTARTDQFRKDVAEFLELSTPLPPMVHAKPGKSWHHKEGLQSVKDAMKIDICDAEHILVRKELMRISRGASVWIRDYFLDESTFAAGVHVSSPKYLKHLFRQWMNDPCGDEKTRRAGSQILAAVPEDRKKQGRPVKSEDEAVEQ